MIYEFNNYILADETKIEEAYAGERIFEYLDRMHSLRMRGIEVICKFNGILFSNMDGESVAESQQRKNKERGVELDTPAPSGKKLYTFLITLDVQYIFQKKLI